MGHLKSFSAALAALLIAIILLAGPAPANPASLETYLVGKWHQEYGPYVTETVLTAKHTFTSITVQPGTPYRLHVEGTWEIRNEDELWLEWTDWVPHNIQKPLPEGSKIEIIDQDRFRNKLGIVTRMK